MIVAICIFAFLVVSLVAYAFSDMAARADKPFRVYIAGPVTGIANFNQRIFSAAAYFLSTRGYEVIDPVAHCLAKFGPNARREVYLEEGKRLLKTCDAIFLLPGWEASDGAVEEYKLAQKLGLEVMH